MKELKASVNQGFYESLDLTSELVMCVAALKRMDELWLGNLDAAQEIMRKLSSKLAQLRGNGLELKAALLGEQVFKPNPPGNE